MADQVVVLSNDAQLKDCEFESFYHNYIDMISWDERKWDEDPETRNLYEFTVKNLRYWSKVLKPALDDKTLIFGVFKRGKLITFNEKYWINFLRKIDALHFFENFYYVRNSFITGIQLNSAEGKAFIVEKMNVIEEGYVIQLDWYLQSLDVNLRVHWLPKGYFEHELKAEIQKYVEVTEFKREITVEDEKLQYPSNVISVRGILRAKSKDDIPHLFNFRGLETLFVVRGRQPMCLKCEAIGHKAFECTRYHCVACRVMHERDYVCKLQVDRKHSFAEKLKSALGLKMGAQDWPSLKETRRTEEQAGESLKEDTFNYIKLHKMDQDNKDLQVNRAAGVVDNLPSSGPVSDWAEDHPPDSIDILQEMEDTGERASVRLKDSFETLDMDCEFAAQKRRLEADGGGKKKKESKTSRMHETTKTYGTTIVGVKTQNLFDKLTDQSGGIFD